MQLIKQSELTFVWATESLPRLQAGIDASKVTKERTHLLLPTLFVLLCPRNRNYREHQKCLIGGNSTYLVTQSPAREHANIAIMCTICINSITCSSSANWKDIDTADHLWARSAPIAFMQLSPQKLPTVITYCFGVPCSQATHLASINSINIKRKAEYNKHGLTVVKNSSCGLLN